MNDRYARMQRLLLIPLKIPSSFFILFCLTTLMPLAGCTKFDLLNATVPACGYRRTADLSYGDQPRQKLDVYLPHHATANPAKSEPGVVIFFYGGNWRSGSKDDYRFVAQSLTSRGFITVLPDYRLYPSVTFPAFVEDGALAVRWVHDHISRFGGDPRRIYLMGHSAGAHIAALLTLDEHYLQEVGLNRNTIRATAALSGPYDFIPSPNNRPIFGMARNDLTPDPRIKPITFADGHAPPMLLVHGLRDQTVDPANTWGLAGKIRASGGKARTLIYPHRGHAGVALALAFRFSWLAPVLRDTTAFFREHP